MLTVIRTTHSRHPWRLTWHGVVVADVHFRTQREAREACRALLTLADFALPGPEAWSEASRARVAAYVARLPCVQELERLQARDLARGRPRSPSPRSTQCT